MIEFQFVNRESPVLDDLRDLSLCHAMNEGGFSFQPPLPQPAAHPAFDQSLTNPLYLKKKQRGLDNEMASSSTATKYSLLVGERGTALVLLFILHFICPDPNVLFPFGFRLPKAKEKMQPLIVIQSIFLHKSSTVQSSAWPCLFQDHFSHILQWYYFDLFASRKLFFSECRVSVLSFIEGYLALSFDLLPVDSAGLEIGFGTWVH